MSEFECGNNDENGEENNLVSLQDLSKQVEKILQTALSSIKGIDDISDISAVVLVSSKNKVIALQSKERPLQQPLQLFMVQDTVVSTTYEARWEGDRCWAYKILHFSNGTKKPEPYKCAKYSQEENGIQYTIQKKNGKCCIVWQQITYGKGGQGDTYGPENEYDCA